MRRIKNERGCWETVDDICLSVSRSELKLTQRSRGSGGVWKRGRWTTRKSILHMWVSNNMVNRASAGAPKTTGAWSAGDSHGSPGHLTSVSVYSGFLLFLGLAFAVSSLKGGLAFANLIRPPPHWLRLEFLSARMHLQPLSNQVCYLIIHSHVSALGVAESWVLSPASWVLSICSAQRKLCR